VILNVITQAPTHTHTHTHIYIYIYKIWGEGETLVPFTEYEFMVPEICTAVELGTERK